MKNYIIRKEHCKYALTVDRQGKNRIISSEKGEWIFCFSKNEDEYDCYIPENPKENRTMVGRFYE